MWLDQEQLKNFLADSGLVAKADLEAAYAAGQTPGSSFEAALLASGKISTDDLRRAKAYVLGIPFVDLKKLKIDREILKLIPEPIARTHNIIAYARSATGLEVAMLDPGDLEAVEFIKKSSGGKVLVRLTDQGSIKTGLLQYQKSLKAEFGDIVRDEAAKLAGGEGGELGEEDLKKLAADLPVVRIVDSLLAHAIGQKASDIHIEVFEQEVVVRYRIDGLLHDAMLLPKSAGPGIVARIKVLASLRLDEKRLPQDGRFKIETNGQKVSFRVSLLPTYYGEKVVMRLLPETSKGLSLEEGGLHGEGLERIHRALRRTTGMILVTGPTGSGKSTTLYTLMEILNTPDVNISTVEDPVEYRMPRVNQTQVNSKIGMTFASALRALLRQDPDIIMVGEIRDEETLEIALHAAMTGHLVLSTLHTNGAAAAIPRMIDMGAEPFLIASTTNVVIAQRLVRRLCSECREEYHMKKAEVATLGKTFDVAEILQVLKKENQVQEKLASVSDWEEVSFFRAKGCDQCGNEGYRGRIGIYEVFEMTSDIRRLVMESATSEMLEKAAKEAGMLTMVEDGFLKAVLGCTSVEEILRVTKE